ncbi:MAG: prepilin-type N-terminal cleavage/methylation domain-containing protein [Acidobacteria bacterium]|nr:prepilin-type N-terminal cleavage/methylation domain-containing protein [Acidobacteriota bacterium]
MNHQPAVRNSRMGFTLIELTVVLAVIVTLALVLTPSIANFINDSRVARARNDCQTVASGIYQFFRDTGYFPQWKVAKGGGAGLPANRLQLLVSRGGFPLEDVPTLWTTGAAGGLTEQLVNNTPGYTLKTASSQFGWNGPYFSSEIGADPWGNRYVVNIGLIDTSPGAATAAGQPKLAVWVLSAGPNGTIETPFSQSILNAAPGGDDIATRIQ